MKIKVYDIGQDKKKDLYITVDLAEEGTIDATIITRNNYIMSKHGTKPKKPKK